MTVERLPALGSQTSGSRVQPAACWLCGTREGMNVSSSVLSAAKQNRVCIRRLLRE